MANIWTRYKVGLVAEKVYSPYRIIHLLIKGGQSMLYVIVSGMPSPVGGITEWVFIGGIQNISHFKCGIGNKSYPG